MNLALTPAERASLMRQGLIKSVATPLKEWRIDAIVDAKHSFKGTPGPKDGVPYRSPYARREKK